MKEPDKTVEQIVEEQMAYQNLRDAILERNYPTLYACLRKKKGLYFHEEAYGLCRAALESHCTLKAFQAILERCIPMEEFCYYPVRNYVTPGGTGGLVEEAAANDCVPILKYLLEQGFSPNARAAGCCSALEAAIWNGAMGCVTFLCQREDLDTAVTENLLGIWGSMGMCPERDCCFRIAAERLLGVGAAADCGEVPVLPRLNVIHAARYKNWDLVGRLCREGEVTKKQGKEVIDLYLGSSIDMDLPQCAKLLDALFSACPVLLRCQVPRGILARCILVGNEKTMALLRPWAERLPGREIVVVSPMLSGGNCELADWMCRWDERMGSRFRLVLRRDRCLPVGETWNLSWDQAARTLLTRCFIRGGAPKGGGEPAGPRGAGDGVRRIGGGAM